MPGLLNFLSQYINDYKIILALLLIIAISRLWSSLEKSEKWLRYLVSIQPKNAHAHLKLGNFLVGKNALDDAEREIRLAIELNPTSVAYHSLADILKRKKVDEQEVNALYQQMILKLPNDPYAYLLPTTTLMKERKFVEAEQTVRQTIHVAPRFGPAYVLLGGVLRLQKRLPEAVDAYEKAIQIGEGAATTYYDLAQTAKEIERYPIAEKAYRRVLALEPSNLDAYRELVDLLKKQERYDAIGKLLKKGIEINPDAAILKSQLAYYFNHQGQKSEALALLDEIASLETNDSYTFYTIAYLYHALKFYPQAETAYRNSIRKDPNTIILYGWLGRLLIETEKYQAAEEIYQQAILIDSKEVNLYWELATLYHIHLKRYQDADDALQKVIELKPNNATAFYDIACANSLLQNKERALEYLKISIEKGAAVSQAWEDPDLEWIRNDPAFVEIVGPKPETKPE